MPADGRVGVVHVHSTYSRDGRDSLERLREFALEHGLAFVALTDHAEDVSAEEWSGYVRHCAAVSDARVNIIPGLEFRFSGYTGLHLLALGLARWIDPGTPAEFIALAGQTARLTIVAHPILVRYRVPGEVRAGIDAVEVWNAAYNTRWLPDPRAIRLLHDVRRFRPEVVGIVGLDQHDCTNDRETRIVVSDASSDPLHAMKAGRFRNRARTMHFGPEVGIHGAPLGLLSAARWVFDRVERAQDSVARALVNRRRPR